MILGFGDKRTEDLYNGVKSARVRGIAVSVKQRALDRLTIMDAAANVNDLRVPPSNHLEQLSGNLAGFWSIRVNLQWRIIFRWPDGAAGPSEVKLTDYH